MKRRSSNEGLNAPTVIFPEESLLASQVRGELGVQKAVTRLPGPATHRDDSDGASDIPQDPEGVLGYLKLPCLRGVSYELQGCARLSSR